uniref:Uncharacterized protein n=1 Tax=Solanum lycopersicum TaxID=4081 RepID=A0A3Q7EHC0_SOLLC
MNRFTNRGEFRFASTSDTTISDGCSLLTTLIAVSKQLGMLIIARRKNAAWITTASSGFMSKWSSVSWFLSGKKMILNEKGKFKELAKLSKDLPVSITLSLLTDSITVIFICSIGLSFLSAAAWIKDAHCTPVLIRKSIRFLALIFLFLYRSSLQVLVQNKRLLFAQGYLCLMQVVGIDSEISLHDRSAGQKLSQLQLGGFEQVLHFDYLQEKEPSLPGIWLEVNGERWNKLGIGHIRTESNLQAPPDPLRLASGAQNKGGRVNNRYTSPLSQKYEFRGKILDLGSLEMLYGPLMLGGGGQAPHPLFPPYKGLRVPNHKDETDHPGNH